MRAGAGVQHAEDVLDLIRVKRPHLHTVIIVSRRAEREKVVIHGCAAGLHLCLQPPPGGVSDESITGVVSGRIHRFGITVGWVERQETCRLIAEVAAGALVELGCRHGRLGVDNLPAAFIRAPSRK